MIYERKNQKENDKTNQCIDVFVYYQTEKRMIEALCKLSALNRDDLIKQIKQDKTEHGLKTMDFFNNLSELFKNYKNINNEIEEIMLLIIMQNSKEEIMKEVDEEIKRYNSLNTIEEKKEMMCEISEKIDKNIQTLKDIEHKEFEKCRKKFEEETND